MHATPHSAQTSRPAPFPGSPASTSMIQRPPNFDRQNDTPPAEFLSENGWNGDYGRVAGGSGSSTLRKPHTSSAPSSTP
eukprot:CAMPEP_0180391846 /NCGR_PEP_ID=MMETSP0989-20121125/32832_1 /TAXON_ID=697907 /ORGANISM="non described non described, Strain CCMP2293" /LENGTH=78 /DNA_ID=CAMNT_0022393487 /DNA_START=18 /DNA_END=255 /DNA_ORIENTATION=-